MTVSSAPSRQSDRTISLLDYYFAELEKKDYLAWFQKVASALVPVVALGIALLGIACASIFIVIAEQDTSPNATTFNRLLMAAIAFGVWNGLQHLTRPRPEASPETRCITRRDIALVTVAGISFAASLALSAWSLTQTSVANSALLNNMMPIFTTLGAWLLLGQRFSVKFLIGLVVAIGGVVAIGIEDLHAVGSHLVGDGAALLAALLAAAAILGIEQLRVKFSTPMIMMGTSLCGSLSLLPCLVFSNSPVLPASWDSGLAIVALAAISQVMGHGLLTYSLKQFSSGLVSMSMLLIPVITSVLAMFIFSEQLSLLNWLAFSVVLTGISLAISGQKRCAEDCS